MGFCNAFGMFKPFDDYYFVYFLSKVSWYVVIQWTKKSPMGRVMYLLRLPKLIFKKCITWPKTFDKGETCLGQSMCGFWVKA